MGKRKLLIDGLSNLVAFFLIFNIFVLFYAIANNAPPWPYLSLAAPFFSLYFLRRRIRKMLPFIASHVVLLALPLATLGNLRAFLPLMGFAIVSTVYSMSVKGKGEWSISGGAIAWVIGTFALLSLVFAYYAPEMQGIATLLNMSSLICLAAAVLHMHLNNMRFSLSRLREHQNKPAEAAQISNILIVIFLAMILIFGALSMLFPSEVAVLVLGRLLLDILLLPFRLIGFLAQFFGGEQTGQGGGPLMLIPEMGGLLDPDPFAEYDRGAHYAVITTIAGILSAIIILALALAAVMALLHKLQKAFGEKDTNREKESLMPDDIISKLKFVLGDAKGLLPRFRLSVRHPVRRAYIKKINSHIKQGLQVLPNYTPEVIADKIRPKENIDDLTQKYEEVRYGRP